MCPKYDILSVNGKLPLLTFRYFENCKRNLDSYFTFRVSGQLQTRLVQQTRSPSPATREQLLHVHIVLSAVYQNVKTLFSKTNMPVYAWKIFLENAIEMVSIIPSNRANEAQIFMNHHHLASSHRTQWKHLVSRVSYGTCWCSLVKGYRAFLCDEHHFL